MKKIGLSLFIILLFVAYSFQQRNDSEASARVTPNPTMTTANTAVSSAQNTSTNSSMMSGSSMSQMSASGYKDGTYTGTRSDAVYGFIQVQTTVSGGRITDVVFLEYPNDHHESVQINQRAMPFLKQEAIQAQSAQVDGVSGATDTSIAFVESLTAALNKAKA